MSAFHLSWFQRHQIAMQQPTRRIRWRGRHVLAALIVGVIVGRLLGGL